VQIGSGADVQNAGLNIVRPEQLREIRLKAIYGLPTRFAVDNDDDLFGERRLGMWGRHKAAISFPLLWVIAPSRWGSWVIHTARRVSPSRTTSCALGSSRRPLAGRNGKHRCGAGIDRVQWMFREEAIRTQKRFVGREFTSSVPTISRANAKRRAAGSLCPFPFPFPL